MLTISCTIWQYLVIFEYIWLHLSIIGYNYLYLALFNNNAKIYILSFTQCKSLLAYWEDLIHTNMLRFGPMNVNCNIGKAVEAG